MGGETYYGTHCNRVIVSRLQRYCGYCGGPLTKDPGSGLMERTSQPTYVELVKIGDTWLVRMDDFRAQIETLEHDLSKMTVHRNSLKDDALGLNRMIDEMEGIIALMSEKSAEKAGPRAPDLVILTSAQPGVSGGLASVQEACSWISERGVNRGTPCIRPAEPNQKHAKGRHRYA